MGGRFIIARGEAPCTLDIIRRYDLMKEILLFVGLFIGVIGTIMPFVPGIPLMFLIIIIYSFLENWQAFSTLLIVTTGVLTLISFIIDYFASAIGVKKYGGSKYAPLGAIVGSILGVVMLGPFGLVFGAFGGVIAIELLVGKKFEETFKAATGTFIGMLGGSLVSFIIALVIFIWVIIEL
ncbi:MAG: DUF456 domain-containing protein [Clostridiales bacterium]|nr:DUF456 domain-containing protein [Clostridiales bacterium]